MNNKKKRNLTKKKLKELKKLQLITLKREPFDIHFYGFAMLFMMPFFFVEASSELYFFLCLGSFILISAFYDQKNSLLPIVETSFGKVAFYPGLFSRKVILSISEIELIKYENGKIRIGRKQRRKYPYKFYFYLKNMKKPIIFYVRLTRNELDNLIEFLDNFVNKNIKEYQIFFD